ncbi:beta-N-acetylhexosaminidase [Maribellus sp. CM-23]|uniref:beta-N-acetylhexosaminidase n=1 Tax=Maribellus sp. CM-23 TaxID=2781026 RepID=UPI001F27B79B|nr:beta-N-acetylhexosaminidase [Maribellus sp. CM-23]MCE4566978.1 beta-N-acetylhexosaminidase [Maribellus sp. CM-23]
MFAKFKRYLIFAGFLFIFVLAGHGQNILPTPYRVEKSGGYFLFSDELFIGFTEREQEVAEYLRQRLEQYVKISGSSTTDNVIRLQLTDLPAQFGEEGYQLLVNKKMIEIKANNVSGLFYGVQSFLQLLPEKVQAGKEYALSGYQIPAIEVHDYPKYAWRSFMLDSGRQYQTPEFIKRYLDYMAMLKMNVFHWHLTEGQGWRIEIKKYPKLTDVGSKVATGKEQQGFYTQEEIKDIVEYARKLHITVVPEMDVPGHSEAALTAYPELSCFGEAPASVMSFSDVLFCGGREETYTFLENVLDEVCELFPSSYIHLGGDEAPKGKWNQCLHCQGKIKQEGLKDSHELQMYFSTRLANYLQTKEKKVIFWGDVIYQDNIKLPDNVIVHWWNWRGHKDLALKNAIRNRHQVIANTNYYTYLNFPVSPWSKYSADRTFDMRTVYENNPSDMVEPDPLVLGMGCALWTDWYVCEHMVDRRVFPRIFALAEQMWSRGERLPFDEFYRIVKEKYPVLREKGVDIGPGLKEEMEDDFSWD